jgi:glycerol-3-phosphate dehydrogenase
MFYTVIFLKLQNKNLMSIFNEIYQVLYVLINVQRVYKMITKY